MVREHGVKSEWTLSTLVSLPPAWTRPTPDKSDCPKCGKDSCDGTCEEKR
jgi:hypothetical protein